MSKPSHNIFVTRPYTVDGKEKTEFTKIGVLFAHESGKGFQGKLVAAPIDGKIVVLENTEKEPDPSPS